MEEEESFYFRFQFWRGFWGKGIMTEALRAVLKHGFEKMGVNRIQAIIDSKNTRSMKLVERLGFKKEGVLRQRSYFNGQFRDEHSAS